MEQLLLSIVEKYGVTVALTGGLAVLVKYFVVRDYKQTQSDIKTMQSMQATLENRLEEESRIRELRFTEIEGDVEMLKTESLHSLQLINQNIAGIQEVIKQHVVREERYQDKMDEFRGYVYQRLGRVDHEEDK